MRKGKILKGAVVLLLAIAMIFSSVAVANTRVKQTEITLNTTHEGSGEGARGVIVWDNGMDYSGLGAAQKDDVYPFYAECADDFHFEEDTEVCDVHWIGGYWNGDEYNQIHWPWEITFYYDDGTGERPGNVFLGPFEFDSTEYTEVFIEDTGGTDPSIYYEFSVDLPENYIFIGCEIYWIAIRGVGLFPPQSGWGLHDDPITLHEAVFRSELLGFPDWTDSFDVFGYSADMCFQLTTKGEVVPLICCDPGMMDWTGVPPGSTVTGTFHVWNCGDDGSTLTWKVDTWPAWMTGAVFNPPGGNIVAPGPGTDVTFTFTAPTNPNTPFSGTIKVINVDDSTDFCEMDTTLETPRSRGTFFNFFEYLMNQFPMLKILFGL